MRGPSGQRLVAWSQDGGTSWSPSKKVLVGGLGRYAGATCEDSTIAASKALLFSTPFHPTERANMTVFASHDAGLTYEILQHIDGGPSAYSPLVLLNSSTVGLAYESAGYSALQIQKVYNAHFGAM
eukprot:SAG31_NODE_9281_length_1305_cov_1.792703_1_plen_126_part_00